MYPLARHVFDRVLQFVNRAYEQRDTQEFVDFWLREAPRLVPALCHWHVHLQNYPRLIEARSNPAELIAPDSNRIIFRHYETSPVLLNFRRTQTSEFVRRSDLEPFSVFERTAIYNELFRPLGARDSCGVIFPGSAGDGLEYLAAVQDRRVSDQERNILCAVAPHFLQAYRNASRLSAIEAELSEMRSAVEILERGILTIDDRGKIKLATGRAAELLNRYFDEPPDGKIAGALQQWVSKAEALIRKATDLPPARLPMVVERDGRRLVVRMFSAPGRKLLVLEEQITAIPRECLEALGLTVREAEVLTFMALGKTNPEIATILGGCTRTIEKHVEHILEKLGVETRGAAAVVARSAASLRQ